MKRPRVFVSLLIFFLTIVLAILFPYLRMPVSLTCGFLFLLLLYFIAKKEFEIEVPLLIVFLLFLGAFVDSLGNALNLYGKKLGPLWYDSWVHLFTPFCLSLSLSWLFYYLKRQRKIKMKRWVMGLFVFSLITTLSAFYEVTELWDELYFGGKRIWGEQDTARDLQWNMTGALLGTLSYRVIMAKIVKDKENNEDDS